MAEKRKPISPEEALRRWQTRVQKQRQARGEPGRHPELTKQPTSS